MNGKRRIGMVGLGVMGRNLALNAADHGFSVAGFDTDARKRDEAIGLAGDRPVQVCPSLANLVDALAVPRAVLLMVPAGPPVDAVIGQLLPILGSGDCIIDGGNSFYKDTDLRAQAAGAAGINYLGVGISGGEYGARSGPSIMPAGPPMRTGTCAPSSRPLRRPFPANRASGISVRALQAIMSRWCTTASSMVCFSSSPKVTIC